MEGWIMLHRKLLDNPIFKNHKLLQVFIYCLLKASHKEHDQLVGDQMVKLKSGDLVTGRKAISIKTGLSEQNVRTALNRLEKLQKLTIRPTSKYSVISIVNWNTYQQTNQQVTNGQPTSNQQVTTNKNVNNDKECKEILVQDANAPKPVGTMLTNQQPFPIYKTDVELWADTYPAVNIIPELKKINAWLDANPTKRKTERGMKKFINNWLSRAQDNPRQSAPQAKQTHATYTDIVNDENFW